MVHGQFLALDDPVVGDRPRFRLSDNSFSIYTILRAALVGPPQVQMRHVATAHTLTTTDKMRNTKNTLTNID